MKSLLPRITRGPQQQVVNYLYLIEQRFTCQMSTLQIPALLVLLLLGVVIVYEPGSLCELGTFVDKVASKEQHIARLHSVREPHKHSRVQAQGCEQSQ